MHRLIDQHPAEITPLCRHFGVRRLEVFGSAARGDDFAPDTSDVDFLVEFEPDSSMPPLQQFFGLAEALERLVGRRVDLVEKGAIRDPFILSSIERSHELVLCRVMRGLTYDTFRAPSPRYWIFLPDWMPLPEHQAM